MRFGSTGRKLSCSPRRVRFSPYQQGSTKGTGDRESRRNPQHNAIACNKSVIDRLARERVICFGSGNS